MAEFVIKLADERGRVQEQVQTAATAEELIEKVRPRSGRVPMKSPKLASAIHSLPSLGWKQLPALLGRRGSSLQCRR